MLLRHWTVVLQCVLEQNLGLIPRFLLRFPIPSLYRISFALTRCRQTYLERYWPRICVEVSKVLERNKDWGTNASMMPKPGFSSLSDIVSLLTPAGTTQNNQQCVSIVLL